MEKHFQTHLQTEVFCPLNEVGNLRVVRKNRILGGDISQSFCVVLSNEKQYFVKINTQDKEDMFICEYESLLEIAQSNTVLVPKPLAYGCFENTSYIVLDYLNLGNPTNMIQLGQQLAIMHQNISAQFGWHRDNYIGSTIQGNTCTDDWPTFWAEQRLMPQLQLARQNGALKVLEDKVLKLCDLLPEFLNHNPKPSLLHGDLWAGNAAADDLGRAVVYDPALYYGDREVDIAMTELFGGFSSSFYEAYQKTWALPSGYSKRKTIYNLYHILNHYNLFGGSYAQQAQRMTESLL